MKLVAQDNVKKKIWQVGIEPIDSYGKIEASIGLRKGDLIVFAGPGDPRRFSSGSVAGKALMTDPNAPLGWTLANPGSNPTIELRNVTAGQVLAGRVMAITYTTTIPSATLAAVNTTHPLYIAADDVGAYDYVECYGYVGSIVPVLCEGTVAVGDTIAVTSQGYGGKATSASQRLIGVAVTAKEDASGYDTVKVVLTGTGGISNEMNPEVLVSTFSGTTLTLTDKYEHRNNTAIGSLQITLPASPSTLFFATVSFTASSAFTGVTFRRNSQAYTIKNVGHALNKKSVRYNLGIWWDGVYFWCSTKAV